MKPAIGEDVVTGFQNMIYAQSLAYNHSKALEDSMTMFELQQIGGMAGHFCLAVLDKRMTPRALAACSVHELRALFIFIIGTIPSVGFNKPSTEFPVFPIQQACSSPFRGQVVEEANFCSSTKGSINKSNKLYTTYSRSTSAAPSYTTCSSWGIDLDFIFLIHLSGLSSTLHPQGGEEGYESSGTDPRIFYG